MSTTVPCYSPKLGKMAPHVLAPDCTGSLARVGGGMHRCDGCGIAVTDGEWLLLKLSRRYCGRCGRERGWLVPATEQRG